MKRNIFSTKKSLWNDFYFTFLHKSGRYGPCGAHCPALSTADTFRAVAVLRNFHRHGTGLFTLFTANAPGYVKVYLVKAETVKYRIKCPQRTEIPAERAVDKHGRDQHCCQNQHLPVKKDLSRLPKPGIRQHEGMAAAQSPGRTQILAKIWGCNPCLRHRKHRKQNHHHQENDILYISCRFIDYCRHFTFRNRYLMQ